MSHICKPSDSLADLLLSSPEMATRKRGQHASNISSDHSSASEPRCTEDGEEKLASGRLDERPIRISALDSPVEASQRPDNAHALHLSGASSSSRTSHVAGNLASTSAVDTSLHLTGGLSRDQYPRAISKSQKESSLDTRNTLYPAQIVKDGCYETGPPSSQGSLVNDLKRLSSFSSSRKCDGSHPRSSEREKERNSGRPKERTEKGPVRSVHPSAFYIFSHYLMGIDPLVRGGEIADIVENDLCDAWSIAPKRRGVYNLVQVPMRLERLLIFSVFICADEFLFLFTLLPIRCALAVGRWLWALLTMVCFRPLFSARASFFQRFGIWSLTNCRVSSVIDLMHMSIFVVTCVVLASIDISSVYHSIRGQSVIKLYVVFNVMEIFDRLCCSFGVDILDSLGWTTANAVNYFGGKLEDRARSSSQGREELLRFENAIPVRPFRGFVLLTRVMVDYVFTLIYVCVHSTILLIWVVTLNVAINTQNNALLTLLVSNNFVELKGAVFKSYKVQNLFQIACSDAVERFQLTLFLGGMLAYAQGDRRLLLTWGIVFACEVVVDWIKHAFVTKFNRIPHRAYQQFSMVICHDIVNAKRNAAVRSIGGSGVAKRVGFVSLPLGALVVRMSGMGIAGLPPLTNLLIFMIMLTTKISLSVGLLGHAIRRINPGTSRGLGAHDLNVSGPQDDDENWYKFLVNVGRYEKS